MLISLKGTNTSTFSQTNSLPSVTLNVYTTNEAGTTLSLRNYDLPLKFGPFIKLVNSSICSLLYFSLALWPYWVVKRPRGRVADIRGHYAASYDYTHFANALQAL